MASSSRRQAAALNIDNIEFFQAVWRLLQQHKRPLTELIRFRVQPELAFFGNDVTRIEQKKTGKDSYYELWLSFMGLIGAAGTLPAYFREELLQHEHQPHDSSVQLLYDWLQQRAVQLMYEGWSRRHIATQVAADTHKSSIATLLASVAGMQENHPWQHDPYTAYFHYFSAHFANPRRPAAALQQILASILQQPITIVPMQGDWLPLAPGQCTSLSSTTAELGRNTVTGNRIWSPQAKLRIEAGLLSEDVIQEFLPDGKHYLLIQQMLRRYAGDMQRWELQLLIDNLMVQPCRLGISVWSRLGQTSFLGGVRTPGINSDIKLGVTVI